MKAMMKPALMLLVAAFVLAACGGQDESAFRGESFDEASRALMASTEDTAESMAFPGEPEPTKVDFDDFAMEEMEEEMAFGSDSAMDESAVFSAEIQTTSQPVAQPVTQDRIIVRTVDATLVVDDVAGALEQIGTLATDLGGWVVSSEESVKHSGFISFRVPADQLDTAISRLRDLSAEVERLMTTSRDVTDEYVDNKSRLTNLLATTDALRELLTRAATVEEALKVQETLTRTQGEIEVLQGRIKLLEETSAFSLLQVRLTRVSGDLALDPGADQTVSVGQIARFKATFTAPEDVDEFEFTWDFGDGSRLVSSNRTAPTSDENVRVTATITHVYGDDRDSPYFAGIEMTATGEGGVFEGKEVVTVTVTRLPSIEVFAGESVSVDEGEQLELTGSFTRPEGLSNVRYKWDFGDGAPLSEGPVAEGETQVTVIHEYKHHRPQPYRATLTILADSGPGDVESAESVFVFVREGRGWVIGGWSAGEQWKTAVRALSGVGQAFGTFFIWLGILSPIWLVAGGAVVFGGRRWRRRSRS